MKICFHVDESARWPVALTNVANTLKAFDTMADEENAVVIIVNAEAVIQLTSVADIAEQIESNLAQGVSIAACKNALVGHHIAEDELVAGVDVVPAGIIALAEKQSEGFAYIRP